jgi:hypothetical protein
MKKTHISESSLPKDRQRELDKMKKMRGMLDELRCVGQLQYTMTEKITRWVSWLAASGSTGQKA